MIYFLFWDILLLALVICTSFFCIFLTWFKVTCILNLTICRFVPEEFEGIFKKYAKIRRDALTYAEMEFMLADNLDPLDPSSV
jgi:hypothetical protein